MTTPATFEQRSAAALQVLNIELAAAGDFLRRLGIILVSLGVGTSSTTTNWIVAFDARVNFFPEFGGRVIYLSDPLLLGGVVLWGVGWRLFPGPRLNLGPQYVWYPLLVLVALTALSTVWASDAGLAGFATTRRVLLLAVYVVLVNDGNRWTTTVAGILLAVVVLQTAVAWAQVRQGTYLGLTILGELNDTNSVCPRPTSLGFHANPLGMFLGVGGTLAYAAFLFANEGWAKRALLALVAIGLVGLLITQSRSAYLGWLGGGVAITVLHWFWNRTQRPRLLRSAGVVVILTIACHWALPVLSPLGSQCVRTNRFERSDFVTTRATRFADWGFAMSVIRQNVWLGVGASNYPLELGKRLPHPSTGPAFTPVHSVALLVWAELGIIGLASWLVILTAPAVWIGQRWRATSVERGQLLWLGPLLVIYAVSMLDFPPWGTQDGRVLMMAILALWAGGVAAADTSRRSNAWAS